MLCTPCGCCWQDGGLGDTKCASAQVRCGAVQGMPLSLSGVRRIMERMDWGDAGAFVGFGEVGADQIDDACDYYILIAPQNVVGAAGAAPLLPLACGP